MRRADVRLFWHPQGDYLAVQVDRFTKTRKSTYTSFELFSVKERDIPMEARHLLGCACCVWALPVRQLCWEHGTSDCKSSVSQSWGWWAGTAAAGPRRSTGKGCHVAISILRACRPGAEGNECVCQVLELPNKGDKILDLQWEPHGNRFAVLHGEGPRPNFSLYGMKDMRTAAKVVQLLGTQTGKQANCIFWSPQARAPLISPPPLRAAGLYAGKKSSCVSLSQQVAIHTTLTVLVKICLASFNLLAQCARPSRAATKLLMLSCCEMSGVVSGVCHG